MEEPGPRFWEVFFEVYEALPRQGPGNRESVEHALALCRDLPSRPATVDLGAGTGGQTLHLAELTSGPIVALERHPPSVVRLRQRVDARGLEDRVHALVGDMARPPFPPASFDLVWSEGALYNVGLERALAICRQLLRPGGHLAFTDAVWRTDDPPADVKAGFDEDYPAMGWVEDVLAAVEAAGFELLGHFTLPDAAWWDDFYTPMERRVAELRAELVGDAEALAALERIGEEPAMHRRHFEAYAYEFVVARLRDDEDAG